MGGMNSANEALWFGVPLLVVPQRGDQHLVARRVAELGAGLRMPPDEVTADRLRDAVRALRSAPEYRERALAQGASLRSAGGPRRAAELILSACKAVPV